MIQSTSMYSQNLSITNIFFRLKDKNIFSSQNHVLKYSVNNQTKLQKLITVTAKRKKKIAFIMFAQI